MVDCSRLQNGHVVQRRSQVRILPPPILQFALGKGVYGSPSLGSPAPVTIAAGSGFLDHRLP